MLDGCAPSRRSGPERKILDVPSPEPKSLVSIGSFWKNQSGVLQKRW